MAPKSPGVAKELTMRSPSCVSIPAITPYLPRRLAKVHGGVETGLLTRNAACSGSRREGSVKGAECLADLRFAHDEGRHEADDVGVGAARHVDHAVLLQAVRHHRAGARRIG